MNAHFNETIIRGLGIMIILFIIMLALNIYNQTTAAREAINYIELLKQSFLIALGFTVYRLIFKD